MIWFFAKLSLAIVLAIFVVSVAAARGRFSSPRWLRHALDFTFLFPLAVPFWGTLLLYPHYEEPFGVDVLPLLPLFYFAAVYGFSRVDRTVLDAARMHGMGLCGTFWLVFLPAAGGPLGMAFGLGICRMVWLMASFYRAGACCP